MISELQINEKLFDQAINYRDNGEYQKAINMLLKIFKEYPDDPKIHGVFVVLGGIYFDMEQYNKSLKYFKKATNLRPKYELASLGLFHSLWDLGKKKQALAEMDRILELKPDSENFVPLLKGLAKEAGNGKLHEIIYDIKRVADKHLS